MIIENLFDFQLALYSYVLLDGTTLGQQIDHWDAEKNKLVFKEESVLKYIAFSSYGYNGKALTKAHIKPKAVGHLDLHADNLFIDEGFIAFARRAIAKADKEYLSQPSRHKPMAGACRS